MSNELHDMIQVSSEETFTEDMGTADWANDTGDGCAECGLAFSFFFGTQFHKEHCGKNKH